MSDPMLIPSLIAYTCEQTGVDGLPETHIQKLLYELSRLLDDDTISEEFTPYYWFYQGPFSPELRDQLQALIEYGTLEVFETQTGHSLYSTPYLDEEILADYGYFYNILDDILEDFNPYNISQFIEKVYRTRAPYPFVSTFKLDIVSPIETFTKKHEFRQYEDFKEIGELNIHTFTKSLIQSLYKAESVIIEEEPILGEFNTLFSNYVTNSVDSLETNYEEANSSNEYIKEIGIVKDLTFDAWRTFANGIRITNEGHDYAFESEISRWTPIFVKKTKAFSTVLKKIESGMYKNSHLYNYANDESKHVVASIIKGYLS